MDADALKKLKAREWEGFGCESHEAKVKVAKNAERIAKKQEKKAASLAQAGSGGSGKGEGKQRKRKGKAGSGSEGEGPVLGKEKEVVKKKAKSEDGIGRGAVVDEGIVGGDGGEELISLI